MRFGTATSLHSRIVLLLPLLSLSHQNVWRGCCEPVRRDRRYACPFFARLGVFVLMAVRRQDYGRESDERELGAYSQSVR